MPDRLGEVARLPDFAEIRGARRLKAIADRQAKGWPPAELEAPWRVFVCSMSDFFHPSVDWNWQGHICAVMRAAPWHTYIVLTKRPERIRDGIFWGCNVWLGISAENQELFDIRWKTLCMRTTNRPLVRFVSVEPMLGPVDARAEEWGRPDWVIAGPETGPGARRCEDSWIEALAAESPVFFDKRDRWWRREFPMPKQGAAHV